MTTGSALRSCISTYVRTARSAGRVCRTPKCSSKEGSSTAHCPPNQPATSHCLDSTLFGSLSSAESAPGSRQALVDLAGIDAGQIVKAALLTRALPADTGQPTDRVCHPGVSSPTAMIGPPKDWAPVCYRAVARIAEEDGGDAPLGPPAASGWPASRRSPL